MINITNPIQCCGCNACAQRCPHKCITLQEDSEGFLYPIININKCIKCNICKKVCPIINTKQESTTIKTYAAINKDETIRQESSSGGIFSLIAKEIIINKGVVFGAIFDKEWMVKHTFFETIKELKYFRGSKYIQSRIEDCYIKAESFLKENRLVLFSGTPCQIAGLKQFLRKDYENLITIDFICHGVPSPKVWKRYLYEICHKEKEPYTIESINFRNKKTGWKNYCFSIELYNKFTHTKYSIDEKSNKNIFMQGFLKNIYLRPSCYHCCFRKGKSNSDITIADYWNVHQIHKNIDDDKGVSLVLINSAKALNLFNEINCLKIPSQKNEALKFNEAYYYDPFLPKYRALFFKKIHNKKIIPTIKIIIFRNKLIGLKNRFLRKIRQFNPYF